MNFWWAIAGAVLLGPVWVALTLWSCRRMWRTARRLSARAKGHEQLVELGRLAGGLAHEIKNPLSTINVNLKLLAEDLARADDNTHTRWLRRLEGVQREAQRLGEILDDFLRFAGHYELQLESVDVKRLVGELTDFFAAQADATHMVIRTALPAEPIRLELDPKLFKQAMLNLMINAAQAMPDGGELLIRVAGQRGHAVIEVIDTGPGISPGQIDRIFEVYYSTKKGGSGLGLPTTRRIVHEHHGTINVQSEPGKGTRFIITIPLPVAASV